jgi:hypothetical protein
MPLEGKLGARRVIQLVARLDMSYPLRAVLAIFAFGVSYLLLQPKDGLGGIVGIASMALKDRALEYSGEMLCGADQERVRGNFGEGLKRGW